MSVQFTELDVVYILVPFILTLTVDCNYFLYLHISHFPPKNFVERLQLHFCATLTTCTVTMYLFQQNGAPFEVWVVKTRVH